MLFDTQINGRMGSPNVAGSTRRLSAGMSPGSFSHRATPAAATANPPLRQRLRIEIQLAAIDRRTGKAGDLRHDRQAASTRCPHLCGREKAPPPLVKPRAHRVPSQANGGLVDHPTDLRLFAKNRNPQSLSQSDARRPSPIHLLFGVS
jgi:hypothetical protein